MTRPPHMNNSNGGKQPMDQRKMAGYGSGIDHGVTRKPSNTILGGSEEALPSMQQGMLNENSLDIGNMPSQPRFSNSFSRAQKEFVDDSPTYETMHQGVMEVAPMGSANRSTIRGRLKNGFTKAKPLLIFTTIAGATYYAARVLSGGRSAARDDADYEDE